MHESKQHPNENSNILKMGWCKNDLIAKYLSYTIYACARWNNKKTTVVLGKVKERFHLLNVI